MNLSMFMHSTISQQRKPCVRWGERDAARVWSGWNKQKERERERTNGRKKVSICQFISKHHITLTCIIVVDFSIFPCSVINDESLHAKMKSIDKIIRVHWDLNLNLSLTFHIFAPSSLHPHASLFQQIQHIQPSPQWILNSYKLNAWNTFTIQISHSLLLPPHHHCSSTFQQQNDTNVPASTNVDDDSLTSLTQTSFNYSKISHQNSNSLHIFPPRSHLHLLCALVNSIVGSGVIGIPYALVRAGFGVGLILLIFVAAITDYSLRLMVRRRRRWRFY